MRQLLTPAPCAQELSLQDVLHILYCASRWRDAYRQTAGSNSRLCSGRAKTLLWELEMAGVTSRQAALQVAAEALEQVAPGGVVSAAFVAHLEWNG